MNGSDAQPRAVSEATATRLLHIAAILARERITPAWDFIMSSLGSAVLLIAQFAFLRGLDPSSDTLRYLALARTAFAFSGGQHLERFLIDGYMSGSLMMDVITPINPLAFIVARSFSGMLASAAATLPGVLMGALLLGGMPRMSWPGAALYAISLIFVWLASTGIALISSAIGVALKQGEAAVQLRVFITQLASGALIPVYLYPEWVQRAIRALPFVHLADTSVAIARGGSVSSMYPQIIWSAALLGIGIALWRRRLARLDVYGG
jgi:ABC-type uncharacterized transport system permease subunit